MCAIYPSHKSVSEILDAPAAKWDTATAWLPNRYLGRQRPARAPPTENGHSVTLQRKVSSIWEASAGPARWGGEGAGQPGSFLGEFEAAIPQYLQIARDLFRGVLFNCVRSERLVIARLGLGRLLRRLLGRPAGSAVFPIHTPALFLGVVQEAPRCSNAAGTAATGRRSGARE